MKFPFCETCLHREDELVCDECEQGEGYELDESLIELCADGFYRVRGAVLPEAA